MLLIVGQSLLAKDIYHKNIALFCLNKDLPQLEIQNNNGHPETQFPWLNQLIAKYNISEINRWITSADERDVDGDVKLMNIYRAVFAEDRDIPELDGIIDEFRAVDDVYGAYKEGIYRIESTPYTPNDPRFDEQWYVTKIMADYAWGLFSGTPGDPDILVGVVDTGVDTEHPEFAGVLYVNPGEDIDHDGVYTSADNNGVDDDGNGYVDDVVGWDFADNDNNIRPPDVGTTHELSHGTHVSGSISALPDNNEGIAGVSFSSKIIATKHAQDGDYTQPVLYSTYDGITYVSKMGAKIINCSYGSTGSNPFEQNAINNAVNNYGCIIVCAAGNDGTDNDQTPHYPSDYSNTIAVAATTSGDIKSSFSNYGSVIDISSPGSSILSTIHWNASGYETWDGTSMASPIAAASYALLWAYYPTWSRTEIMDRIAASADYIDDLNPDYAGQLGAGRVNPYNAIAQSIFPNLHLDSYNYTLISDPNGDGQLNPGESANLHITLMNDAGWQDATGTHVVLSSNSSYISFPDANTDMGTITAGSTKENTSDALEFLIDVDAPLTPITITLTITANQSGSDPYETTETLEVTPTLNQIGFPVLNANIQNPVGVDSIFASLSDQIVAFGQNDSLYMVNNDGSLVSGFPVYVGNVKGAPVIADVDNDGQKEIVVVERGGELRIVERDGTISLLHDVSQTTDGDIAVANMDSDPELEIVFGTSSRDLHAINIDGSEVSGFWFDVAGRITKGVALVDYTENGTPELVYGLSNDELHAQKTDETELPGFPIDLRDRLDVSPVVVHITNNTASQNDYFIFAATGADTLFRINMNGGVIESKYFYGSTMNSAPALADINKDGQLEVVFGTDDGNLHAVKFDGTSLPGFPIQLNGSIISSPVFADFDNDGTIEIVIGTELGHMYVLHSDGSYYRNFPADFDSHQDGSPAISDIDNDGDLEIIVGTGTGLNAIDVQGTKYEDGLWQTYLSNNHRTGTYNYIQGASAIQGNPTVLKAFSLNQNYPNPFNPSTVISYQLPSAGLVNVSVYNVLGQEVSTLLNQEQNAGLHTVTFNAAGFSSGIYIYKLQYRLESGAVKSLQRKMLLMR